MLVEYRLKMLNKRAAKNSEKILSNMHIDKGCVIADIGAGGGYYSLKFSKITGDNGEVYAVDTDIKRIKYIQKIAADNKVANIKTCGIDDDGLPRISKKLDLIFMRDVFHHIQEPPKYFLKLKKMLKPSTQVVIIDYIPNTPGILITKTKHCTPKNTILDVMNSNGYKLVEDIESLYGFSFTIWTI